MPSAVPAFTRGLDWARSSDGFSEMLATVRAMISDKIVGAGGSPLPGVGQGEDYYRGNGAVASHVNDLRDNLVGIIPAYVNTVVHASGSVEGADTVTMWTKDTCLIAANVGGSPYPDQVRMWTNVPAADHAPDDAPAFGNYVGRGLSLYAAWLAELVAVCRKLTHVQVPVQLAAINWKYANTGYSGMSCDDAKAAVNAALAGAAWEGGGDHIQVYVDAFRNRDYLGSEWNQAVGYVARGKLTATFAQGRAQLYLKVSTFRGGSSNNPPVAVDSKWRAFGAAVDGTTFTTDWLANDPVECLGNCGLGEGQGATGWYLNYATAIVAPVFQFT